MRTDAALRCEAMDVLVRAFGVAEASRFITLVKRDMSDYTEWRRDLWSGMTFGEVYAEAAGDYERHKNG